MPLQPPDPAEIRRLGEHPKRLSIRVAHTSEQAVGGFPALQPVTAGSSS